MGDMCIPARALVLLKPMEELLPLASSAGIVAGPHRLAVKRRLQTKNANHYPTRTPAQSNRTEPRRRSYMLGSAWVRPELAGANAPRHQPPFPQHRGGACQQHLFPTTLTPPLLAPRHTFPPMCKCGRPTSGASPGLVTTMASSQVPSSRATCPRPSMSSRLPVHQDAPSHGRLEPLCHCGRWCQQPDSGCGPPGQSAPQTCPGGTKTKPLAAAAALVPHSSPHGRTCSPRWHTEWPRCPSSLKGARRWPDLRHRQGTSDARDVGRGHGEGQSAAHLPSQARARKRSTSRPHDPTPALSRLQSRSPRCCLPCPSRAR